MKSPYDDFPEDGSVVKFNLVTTPGKIESLRMYEYPLGITKRIIKDFSVPIPFSTHIVSHEESTERLLVKFFSWFFQLKSDSSLVVSRKPGMKLRFHCVL